MTIQGISNSMTSVTVIAAPYGAAGPIIAGTSKTGNDIGLGHKVFEMVEGHLGFRIGVRVRATALSDTGVWLEGLWLEGVVSYFSDLTLELESDLISGVGTYANWSINVTGEPGKKGDTGTTGAPGPPGGAPIDSPQFTGNPRAVTVAAADSDTTIATTAFVHAVTASYQPLDGDLTSLAAAAGTNVLYYRSAADTWATVTIGANITFAGGVLSASITGGGGGNVSNSGTPAPGQMSRWVNATTIEGVTLATAGIAPIDSPTFTNTPAAPTAAPGTNTTQLATTAFVKTAVDTSAAFLVIAPGTNTANFVPRWSGVNSKTLTDGLAVGTGANNLVQLDSSSKLPAVDGSLLTNLPASGGAAPPMPQGRLTTQSATPVMTTTQAAKTTLYYTPYIGAFVPIYNGSNFTPTLFSELSALTTDTAKSPAAIGVNKINDWFVWLDGVTLRLGHGPDWTDDSNRSAGTALVRVGGLWLNNAAITNGPAAQRGTYVGTTRSNASSQLDWQYGAMATPPTQVWFGIWNAYNRVDVAGYTGDATANWTYAATTVRAANGQATWRASFVVGLSEDACQAVYNGGSAVSATVGGLIGVGYDATNGFSAASANQAGPGATYQALTAPFAITPAIGFHFVSANEAATGSGTAAFYGTFTTYGVTSKLLFNFRM
jgi:hypothetical protein